jgi:antitoxin (DNA-binding transcriptional repressor) of toxin-antitoxin stability system
MKASIVDLRYKTAEILKALDNQETVTILYHGKARGIISPMREKRVVLVKDHPFFGMKAKREACEADDRSVAEELNILRGSRYDI